MPAYSRGTRRARLLAAALLGAALFTAAGRARQLPDGVALPGAEGSPATVLPFPPPPTPAPAGGAVKDASPGAAPSVGLTDCKDQDKEKGKGKDELRRCDNSCWPINAPPAPPPAPPPVPPLPVVYGMGGFPPPPEKKDPPGSLQDFVRNLLTVQIRGAGTLRLYGLFRGDFDFATARFQNDLEIPFFVLPNDTRFRVGPNAVPIKPNDVNYALYPRLTRLGAEYYGKPIDCLGGAVGGGRIEIDFLTNEQPSNAVIPALNPESRELLRIRLAYVTLTLDEFTLLVGQDWDIIAPLNPSINDNTLMWNAGNMGDRRPQVKFLWDHHLADGAVLQVQNGLALADAVGNPDLEGNGQRDNESFGIPGYEGRLGVVLPSHVEGEKLLAGVWGVLAISRVNGTLPPPAIPVPGQANPQFSQLTNQRFLTNGIGVDLRLPLVPGLTFQGEAFAGENLADFRGGVGQGVNLQRRRPIHAHGGWAELVAKPCEWYQVAVGSTIDDPDDGDLAGLNQGLFPGFPQGTNVGAGVKLNWSWYVSNRFLLGNGLTVGADYTNWNTEYVAFRAGHASLIKFFLQQAF